MITPVDQSFILDQVKQLSEIEMQAFIEELQDHLYKNKMGHLFPDNADRIEELEEELAELQEDYNVIEDKYKSAKENTRKSIIDSIKDLNL